MGNLFYISKIDLMSGLDLYFQTRFQRTNKDFSAIIRKYFVYVPFSNSKKSLAKKKYVN